MRKTIVFVLPSLKTGGAEKFICNLAVAVNEVPDYDVYVYILGGIRDSQGGILYKALCESGVYVNGKEFRKAITIRNLKAFSRFIKILGPSVLLSTVIQADLAVAFYRVTNIWQRKSTKILRRVANSPTSIIDKGLEFLFPLVFREIVLCSPTLEPKGKFVKFWLQTLGASYSTIINGVPADKISNFKSIGRERYAEKVKFSGQRHSQVSFSAGRLEGDNINVMQKGFDLLIEARASLELSDSKNCHVIYGNGPLREELLSLIDHRGLSDFIKIKPAQQIEEILRRHSVLIFPSRFEGLSNVVVESLLAECYVFLSDIPENQIFSRFPTQVKFFDNTVPGLANAFSEIDNGDFDGRTGENLVGSVEDFFSLARCVREYRTLFDA